MKLCLLEPHSFFEDLLGPFIQKELFLSPLCIYLIQQDYVQIWVSIFPMFAV